VTNQHHSAIKVGITSLSSSNSRINEHIRNGWKLESQRNVASLRLALNIEQSIIRWWRSELSAKPCLTQQQMPQGGYTETASLSDVEIVSTLERISSLLAETGEEKIHSIDFPNLIVGSLVQGEANILANFGIPSRCSRNSVPPINRWINQIQGTCSKDRRGISDCESVDLFIMG
jgi:hypothetical protein